MDARRIKRGWAVVLSGCLLLAGCGAQEEPQPEQSIGHTTPQSSGEGSADGGSTDAPHDGGSLRDGTSSIGHATCEWSVEELGELPSAASGSIPGTLSERDAAARASCAGESGAVDWYQFTVEETSILDVSVLGSGSFAPTIELLHGSCGDEIESVFCLAAASRRAIVEPGQTYHLVVDGSTVGASYTLDYALEPAMCTPGETTCSDGALEHCRQGTEVASYGCAGSCADDTSCGGDSCQTARTVVLEADGAPVRLSGHRSAYTNTWTTSGKLDCEPDDGMSVGTTHEMEIFVRLPRLEAGQTLTVTPSDASGSYAFFVLDTCGVGACRAADFLDAEGANRMVWQVPEAGDYVIVIEATSGTPRAFELAFELHRPSEL